MENWDQALSATDSALQSNGSAMRENERYLDSYEAKINKVKNAWTESTMVLQEDFLGDTIVGFTSVATNLINLFTLVVDKVGTLPVVFGTAGTALLLFNTQLRKSSTEDGKRFLKTIVSIFTETNKTSAALEATALKTRLTGQVSKAATASMRGLGVAMRGLGSAATFLMGSLLPMAGFMLAGFGISKLIEKFSEAKRSSEELEKQNRQSLNSLKTEKDTIEELVDSYDTLSKIDKADRNIKQEEEYVKVTNQLADLLPSVVIGEDEKGNAILANSGIVEDHIDLLKRQLEEEQKIAKITADSDLTSGYESLENVNKKIEKHTIKLEDLEEQRLKLIKAANDHGIEEPAGLPGLERKIKEQSDKLKELYNTSNEVFSKISSAVQAVTLDFENLNSTDVLWISDLWKETELTEETVKNLAKQISYLKQELDGSFSLEGLSKEQVDIIVNTTQNVRAGSDEWVKHQKILESVGLSAQQVSDILGRLKHTESEVAFDAKEFAQEAEKLGIEIDTTKPIFDETGETIIGFATAMSDGEDSAEGLGNEVDILSDRISGAKGNFEELVEIIMESSRAGKFELAATTMQKDAYEALADEMSPLNKLLEDMAEGKSISAAEAMELINKEKALADAISIESGQIKINEKAVLNLRNAKLTSYKDMQQAVIAEANQAANAVLSNLNSYKIEIAAIKDLVSAKRSLADIDKNLQSEYGTGDAFSRSPVEKELLSARGEVTELISLYENIDNMSALITQGLTEVGTSSGKLNSSSKELSSNTQKNAKDLESSTFIADKYALALAQVNFALEQQNSIQNKVAKHSKEYRDSLQKELKLLQQKRDLIKAQSNDLNKQIKSGKIKETGVVTTTSSSGSGSKEVASYYLDNFQVTSGFGKRKSPGDIGSTNHKGVDFANGKAGDPVKALASGKVISAAFSNSAGNMVVIQQDDGIVSKYMHMQDGLKVKAGQRVEAGTVLGGVGTTGNSTGNHLHLQLEKNGKAFDPLPYLKEIDSNSSTGNVSKNIAQNAQKLDQAKSQLIDLELELLRINDQISDIPYQMVQSNVDAFNFAIEGLDRTIEHSKHLQSIKRSDSKEYRSELEYQMQQEKKKQELLHQQANYLREEIKNGKLTLEQKEELAVQVDELGLAWWQVQEAIQQTNAELVESKKLQFSRLQEGVDRSIQKSEYYLRTLSETSNIYRRELQEQIKHHEYKQHLLKKEIDYLEDQIESGKLSAEVTAQITAEVSELKLAWKEVGETIEEVNSRIFNSKLQEFADLLDGVDRTLKKMNLKMGLLEEGTAEHNKLFQEQIKHLEYKQFLLEKEATFLKAQLKNTGLSQQEIDGINTKLSDVILSWYEIENAINDVNNSLKEQSESIADDIIETMKNAYRKQKEIALAEKEQELKELTDLYNKYVKSIDDLLRSIDRQEDEDQYNKEVSKRLEEIAKIQQRINLLALDDSYEAQAERVKLEEELAEKQESLSDLQHKREVELRKQNLNDLKDAEKDKYDAKVDTINDEMTAIKRHYDEIIANERKWASIREDIINNNLDGIKSSMNEFLEYFESINEETAASIGISWQELLNTIDEVNKALEGADKIQNQSPSGSGEDSSSSNLSAVERMQENSRMWKDANTIERIELERLNETIGKSIGATYHPSSGLWSKDGKILYLPDKQQKVVDQMKENSQKWNSASPAERKQLEEENQKLGKTIGAKYNSSSGTWQYKGLRLYHKGGVIGDKPTNRLTDLANKLFNAKPGEQVVKSLKGEIQIPPQNIANGFNNISRLVGSLKSNEPQVLTTSTGVTVDNININLHGYKGDKADAKRMAAEFMKQIKRNSGGKY